MSSALAPIVSPSCSRRFSGKTSQAVFSLDEIKHLFCETADLPLNHATALPAQAYTSHEFFDWEVTHVLRSGWQCVAHVSQIPAPGDFLNLDFLGESLIVVRGNDGAVRVLSRVCPHRAMDIMPVGFGYDGHSGSSKGGCGHTRLLQCPYHAWTFDLDGKLKACAEMQNSEGFSRDDHSLHSFRSDVWQGFVFVNLDGAAPPLSEGLCEMEADLASFALADMKLVITREWDCEFNWKVLVENFMESYHHIGIHHKTLQPTMPARTTWTEKERRHYVRAHLPYKKSVCDQLRALEESGDYSEALSPLPGLSEMQKTEWGLFLIHPAFLLATAHDRVIWYRLQPLDPDHLRLTTTTLLPSSVLDMPNFEHLREQATRSLVEFHLEDMEVCTAVQRGLHSGSWRPGRLSHLEMPVWLVQRFLAARTRDVWPTDDQPAAEEQKH